MSSHLEKILELCDGSLLPHSRIHALNAQPNIYVKREDEAGFAMSGCKKRKYASLIPFLLKEGYQQAVVIGSAASNNVTAVSQLLIEKGIQPILFLKEGHAGELTGNRLLTSLLVPKEAHKYLSSAEWPEAKRIAQAYAQDQNTKTFVIPEGACCEAALPGSLSLLDDVLRNEQESGIEFEHIFIDSGTALTAGALVLRNALQENQKQIHIVLNAEDQDYFDSQLKLFGTWWTEIFEDSPFVPVNYSCYFPATAKSFGSVNQTVLNEIKRIAQTEGILTDPIYSAKLFITAFQVIEEEKLEGNVLLVHSGGTAALFGFGERLMKF